MRQLLINSKDRQSSSTNSADFVINIIDSSFLRGINKRISLTEVNIPNTIYLITSTNNTFSFTEDVGGETTAEADLVNGYYNPSTFATMLKTALDAASPNVLTYTISYDQDTAHFTISVSANTFRINFATNHSSLAKICGKCIQSPLVYNTKFGKLWRDIKLEGEI